MSSKDGRHNLVTEYDYLSEKTILSFIEDNVKNSAFFAEESGKKGAQDAEVLWLIDPLDGTVNFAHHLPVFAVSIAALYKNELFSGIIYQPLTEELFVAEKNKGAFLNQKPIHVSSTSDLSEAILATGFPYNLETNPFHCIDHFVDIMKIGLPIRRLGSAAVDLAYTAAGRFEGFFEVGLSPWDLAAGALIVTEAGGKISHWEQESFDLFQKQPVLASNKLIHSDLLRILNRQV